MTQEMNNEVTAEVTKPATATTFADFELPERLQQALNRMQFVTPTPIQAQAIPLALKGKDILGSAQTGTGKTGAFGIPLVAKLMEHPQMTALVMTPTRELASQVMAMLQQLVPVAGIKTALLIGGEPMPKQFMQLKNVPRLVVGTPGRINDHLVRGTLKLHRTGFLVLDETDRMLDMGFSIQIDEIAKHLPHARQTLLFSATMPSNIVKLSAKYMRNPERISVGSTTTPGKNIKQEVIHINEAEKYHTLLEQLEKRDGSVIVFVKTKHGTERLADKLCKEEYRADAIHGDLQQRKRDRVIQNFRDKKFNILVATDVAARGLDIPHIEHVINYDLPQVPEDYIHRIGRTGRAGATGEAVNLLTPADKMKWRAIQRLIDPNAKDEYTQNESRGPAHKSKRPMGAGGFAGKKKPFGNRDFGPGAFGGRGEERRNDAPRGGFGRRDDVPRGGGFRGRDEAPRYERNEERRSDAPRSGFGRRDDAPRNGGFGGRRDDAPRGGFRRDEAPRYERPERDGSPAKPFGSAKPFGAKKPFGGPKPFGAKKPGAKPFGAKKPFGKAAPARGFAKKR